MGQTSIFTETKKIFGPPPKAYSYKPNLRHSLDVIDKLVENPSELKKSKASQLPVMTAREGR